MQTVFRYRNYDVNCTPRQEESGKFGAQVVVTRVGCHPEKAFMQLPVFDTDAEAVAHAKQFVETWLDRNA